MRKAGQAKEKMNILGNFDTKASFGLENRFKLNFKNDPEDILQKVELGNITMPNRSQLIPGVQNLMGVKLGMKFGKLDVTTVIAQQNSRTESIMINGGSQSRGFELRCDNYDENRHFFLSHFFRDQFEKSLKNLPMVTSGVRITRLEVYVTNRTNNVSSMRNLVGLSDLAEKNPYRKDSVVPNSSITAADNKSNTLFTGIVNNEDFRRIDNSGNILTGMGLKNGEDFDARRTEDVNTQHFFVRATNREFNYSNNPTYYTANGSFNEPSFETDPQTFITTVGLYNDANELMAVAKTSQPIVKSFDKEVLIKVKLSF
jgi:cell surface protein SprA